MSARSRPLQRRSLSRVCSLVLPGNLHAIPAQSWVNLISDVLLGEPPACIDKPRHQNEASGCAVLDIETDRLYWITIPCVPEESSSFSLGCAKRATDGT